ncbi:class Ib ribonucleoside-diphosphate reductase assembly flavoprotein NrdI [Bacillus sp. Marseille-P3800]|uniref:class Ib ribonucleoside-diphosphate reductase assembly flavoprotein NrdI n=1 Tax=Bacillus sp. Marseille-P3800 TaxID=2014782 RepID=UPI003592F1CB
MYYYSKTGNIRRFINKLSDKHCVKSVDGDLSANKPYILITHTTGFGEIPKPVQEFLKLNSGLLMGVAVSGNTNWGSNFGRAGELIAIKYNVPLIMKFEMSGLASDVERFELEVGKFEQ